MLEVEEYVGLRMKVRGSLLRLQSVIYLAVISFDARQRLPAVILSSVKGGLEDHQARRFTRVYKKGNAKQKEKNKMSGLRWVRLEDDVTIPIDGETIAKEASAVAFPVGKHRHRKTHGPRHSLV